MEYIKIPLHGKYGDGKFTLVDGDYDGEYFSSYRWYLNPNGYVVRKTFPHEGRGKNDIYLHKEVLKVSKGYVVDHINRDKLDNRGINLRPLTMKGNAINRNRNSYTDRKYKGVSRPTSTYITVDGEKHSFRSKNKWQAVLGYKFLGTFSSEVEAAKKWDEEAYKLYGDLGVYNLR